MIKLKQILIILLTIVMFCTCVFISPYYITAESFDDLNYYVQPDGSVKIFGCSANIKKITVPDDINGRKVSGITPKSIGYKTVDGKKVKINDFLINGYYGTASWEYAKNEDFLFNCLHNFKVETVSEPQYGKKGSQRLTCACGLTQLKETDYLKIPDTAISKAEPNGDGIELEWNVTKGILEYNVYRSTDGGKYELISTVSDGAYIDYEADSAMLKYYVTGAVGKNEGKKEISPVSIDYFKSPNFSLDSKKNGILLKWGKSKNAVKYRVYKKDEKGNYFKLFETSNASENSYIDKNVNKHSEYFYSVVAVDKNGRESAKSADGKSLVFGEHTKVVYLTFDDGPSDNTLKVLKILKKYNAKATFFVTGFDKAEYMKNIVEEGHTIGLHTYSHNYGKIYSSEAEYFSDLEKIRKLVYEKTGVDTKIIRFPGGSSNTISKKYSKGIMSRLTGMVEDKGYKYFDWNVNSGDADSQNVSPSKILNNVKRESSGVSNCVVLMHDTAVKDTTVKALDSICDYYKKQGYEFAGLTANSLPCHQAVNN